MCNSVAIPCVQRYHCTSMKGPTTSEIRKLKFQKEVDGRTRHLLERCVVTCGRASRARAKMRSRARKEASAQDVRRCCKQFAEAKHLEYKSWVDNKVFELIDTRKVKPRNFVTGRWVLTIKTDKQGNFFKANKSQMGIDRFPGQTEGTSADRVTCFHKTPISDELPNGSQQELGPLSH